MGGCLSGDVKGGKQAIGGVHERPTVAPINVDRNDAVDYFFRSRGLYPLSSKIQLSLSALNLLDRDFTSKSDPMGVVYFKKRDGKLEEVGRTEVILNDLNPIWIEKITVNFRFDVVQELVIQIYDVDTNYHRIPVETLKLEDQDFLGEASCVLSELMTKQNQTMTLKLNHMHRVGLSRKLGTLTIRAEEIQASRSLVEMQLRCTNLDNKDFFSKSDPFLRISRVTECGMLVPICKTEVVNDDLNPTWNPICLSMLQFGSRDDPLIIECFDFNNNGRHNLIGKIQISMAGLENLHKERVGRSLVFPSAQHGSVKDLKSRLFVNQFIVKEQFTFLDYISSGFELSFMVAVDFTASNGDPRVPSSLHYIDPSGRLNSYQQAIMDVGEVIQFYDSDKCFPVWGFGGRMFDGVVSHCFELNGSSSGSQEAIGVEGIMAAYMRNIYRVTLAGPTLFGHVIKRAARIASQSLSNGGQKYYVLLIITDGVLSDMSETVDALVKASDLPLSVLIVGVGDANFQQMEALDPYNGSRLESLTGRVSTRDIVQFVPMRDMHRGQASVAQAVLEELPGQFLSYMRCRDIKPRGVSVA